MSSQIGVLGEKISLSFPTTYYSSWDKYKNSTKQVNILVIHWDAFLTKQEEIQKFLLNSEVAVLHYVGEGSKKIFLSKCEGMPVFQFLNTWQQSEVEAACIQIFNRIRQEEQERDLNDLIDQQIFSAQNEMEEAEKKVEEKEKAYELQKIKTQKQKDRKNAIERVLVAIQKAEKISELEKNVSESLYPIYAIEKIKILLNSELLNTEKPENLSVLEVPLLLNSTSFVGKVLYFRKSTFKKYEQVFLKEVSEVLALAVDRWLMKKNINQWKEHWENTFRSISTPILVIDEEYNVVVSNFEKKESKRKCYQALYERESPCEGCQVGRSFQLNIYNKEEDKGEVFEVSGQRLYLESGKKLFVHFYENVSEKIYFERRKVETSKLVELGIIGSSIAHELNNPLAGILSYIQLLLMDIKEDGELKNTLLEMEEASLRCKDTIQNLLGFTRKTEVQSAEQTTTKKMIDKALKIISGELKRHSIDLEIHIEKHALYVNETLFIQALVEVMKNAVDELNDAQKTRGHFTAKIKIECRAHDDLIIFDIIDNGRGILEENRRRLFTPLFTTKNPSHHRGLGLTTVYQILENMSADIEILPVEASGTRVRITLSREKRST